MERTCLFVGGGFSLAVAVFHMFFGRLFGWREELARLRPVNARVLYTIHFFLIPFCLFFAYLSFALTDDLLSGSRLARTLTGFYSLFWAARGAWQLAYFRPSELEAARWMLVAHYAILVLAPLVAVLYGVVAFG
ncbi:MAG: hypothetical protein HYZ53_22550 [Planctomycetes bacterium]|nr:hypothetical protein [Planctomycetota bacterium]